MPRFSCSSRAISMRCCGCRCRTGPRASTASASGSERRKSSSLARFGRTCRRTSGWRWRRALHLAINCCSVRVRAMRPVEEERVSEWRSRFAHRTVDSNAHFAKLRPIVATHACANALRPVCLRQAPHHVHARARIKRSVSRAAAVSRVRVANRIRAGGGRTRGTECALCELKSNRVDCVTITVLIKARKARATIDRTFDTRKKTKHHDPRAAAVTVEVERNSSVD